MKRWKKGKRSLAPSTWPLCPSLLMSEEASPPLGYCLLGILCRQRLGADVGISLWEEGR